MRLHSRRGHRAVSCVPILGALFALACANDEPSRAGPIGAASDGKHEVAPAVSAQAPLIQPKRGVPRDRVLRIGLISSSPANMLARYGPLADRISELAGFEAGEVDVHSSPELIAGRLCDGTVDLLLESVFPVLLAAKSCGARYVAVAGKDNSFHYRTVIVVHQASRFKSLGDLGGGSILFEDPRSTSAYLMPRSMLESAGLNVTPADSAPNKDSVRYRFGGDELNSIGWVVHGLADAAALSNQDVNELPDAELRKIAESKPMPRQLVAAGPKVPPAVVDKLTKTLTALGTDPESKAALDQAETAGFAPLTSGDRETLRTLSDLLELTSK